MKRLQKNYENKIRNVRLVSSDNKDYLVFLENIRLENFKLRKPNKRQYSDILSFPLEITVRFWVEQTGLMSNDRILSYERLTNENKYLKLFNEIDFVFLSENKLWLGEVKTSSSNKAIKKASNQLKRNHHLLSKAGIDSNQLVVHIDLHSESELEFSEFHEDFRKMDLKHYTIDDNAFYYIRIKPEDIFRFGIHQGLIVDSELLEKAKSEAEELETFRNEKQSLIEQNIPKEDWPEYLIQTKGIEDNSEHKVSYESNPSTNTLGDMLKAAFDNKNNNVIDKPKLKRNIK